MIRVSRIVIYPIKSLDGVAAPSRRVLPSGSLEYDRRFALFDPQGRYVNAKREPKLHAIRAVYDLQAPAVTLSGPAPSKTFHLGSELHAASAWLSEALGQPCELRERVDAGFSDDTEALGPTLVGSGSLGAIASWFDGLTADGVSARLRANVELDTPEAFWEDRLVAAPGFSIGHTRWRATGVCRRCSVPPRDPQTGEPIPGFQKRFAELREQTLPAESPASAFDHYYRAAINTRWIAGSEISVGDPIAIA